MPQIHVRSDFIDILKPKYIQRFEFDETIVDIVSKVRMKTRTMLNFFHLSIAMKEGAYFVSGDKQVLEKIRETNIYDKLLTYIDLQKSASSFPGSSGGES